MNPESRKAAVLAEIDRAHAEDPAGKEFDYAQRMTRWLHRLSPHPDPLLEIAVRAQHLKRWECPRSAFPPGREGYLQWRRRAATHHADAVTDILRRAEIEEPAITRIRALIEKHQIAHDKEAQTLEDCACLSFLEADLAEFSSKHPPARAADIVRKTWLKMSPAARALAGAFVDESPDVQFD